jgi:hypothetical protein
MARWGAQAIKQWRGSGGGFCQRRIAGSGARCSPLWKREWGKRGRGSGNEREGQSSHGTAASFAYSGLTGGSGAGVRPSDGVPGLCVVGHRGWSIWIDWVDLVDWTRCLYLLLCPKPWQICKNFPNTNCRATCVLQLFLKDFSLNHNGFQATKLQSRVRWNCNSAMT